MKIQKLWMAQKNKKVSPGVAAGNFLLVCILIVLVFWLSLRRINTTFDFSFLSEFRYRIRDGFFMTVGLSLVSLALSLIIGISSAAGQNCRFLPLRYLCSIYVKFIRGTPLIMQIYLFYYIVGTAWGIENRFIAGVLILSVFEGAYIAEIIRGSLLSIPSSQLQAARALGFTEKQIVQYVTIPQLVARTLPALTGQFASIIKDSSLLSMIAVIELTQTMREISATNFKLFECYLFLGGLYLCLTLPLSFISERLERKFDYEN
ncbi:MAG: amino acid ABC transporter permease [Lachnospiraceae bacterium]|nr:amino acid ABC transporter permease [Lachnospiraceae bacterium]MDY5496746.1 amino acid ABC transporter permease [Anaerobutyricum sp.]